MTTGTPLLGEDLEILKQLIVTTIVKTDCDLLRGVIALF